LFRFLGNGIRSRFRVVASGVIALAFATATPSAALAAPSTKADLSAGPVLTWLSSEQYQAMTGRSADAVPVSALPSAYRLKWSDGVVTKETNAMTPVRPDPPGGQDPQWWIIEYDFHDLAGRNLPVRFGNGALGYLHYASAHNLFSFEPIHASLQTHVPDKQSGAHLEYLALLTEVPSGAIYARIRNVTQNSTVSSDNVFVTPDGKPIGTITAYCENTANNACPNSVDDIATY